jgi:CelD/BcsL family acetyltransferase involved in cellulose biosynthesis
MGVGRPIGTKLSDYQGAVVDPAIPCTAPELVRLSGLRTYRFDHLAATQAAFRPFFAAVEVSPIVDLSNGYAAYVGAQGEAGRGDGLHEAAKKQRRLDRRFAVRFEFHQPDRDALATLFRWKSQQYRRTGVFDVLSRPWVVAVLERLHATQTDELAGALSCLYADERLIAVHFGIRSGSLLHSWFPAYDVDYAKLSPGLVLLSAIIEAAPARGIRTIDLGKGSEFYKDRFANRAAEVGTGAVELDRAGELVARLARAAWFVPLRSPLYTRAHRLRQRLQLG